MLIDATVWRLAPSASGCSPAARSAYGGRDRSGEYAILALQGPRERTHPRARDRPPKPSRSLRYFRFLEKAT